MRFESKHDVPITVSVFNSVGETILTLPEVVFPSGVADYTIDLPDLAAGVYVLHVVGGDEFWIRKIVVTQ